MFFANGPLLGLRRVALVKVSRWPTRKLQPNKHGASFCERPDQGDAALRFQEGQQVGVNGIGLGRGHAVRKALVGFQCAIL